MNRKTFIQSIIGMGIVPSLLIAKTDNMHRTSIKLLRHATLLIELGGKKLLIDPMLSKKSEMEPVGNCGNEIRIPMVDLPIPELEVTKMLSEIDAIVITHLHRDHWDEPAQSLVGKNKLIICSPNDQEALKEQGFKNIQPIKSNLNWEGIQIYRTGGQHGTGAIGKSMGEVAGFVFANNQDSIYVAGDTIWCEEVEKALIDFNPKVTILNAGGAKFLTGDPITMTPNDIVKVYEKQSNSKIIAVHMDTVNHCFVTRKDLAQELQKKGLQSKILIPIDGEVIEL